MGIADSSLKDRVVFVMGSPRSGTTWLASILSVHPAIAGIAVESHLFDLGVERLFDNHDGIQRYNAKLSAYLSREELVDLVRDLCDGVLDSMRQRTNPEARLVVEKTPVTTKRPDLEVERKLECFPDGWYVHIVRDGQAVADSLMRTPWMEGQSHEMAQRVWRNAVDAIRASLEGHPRYMEIPYDELRADPLEQSAQIFGWLGLAADNEVRERVAGVSRHHHARWESPSTASTSARAGGMRARAGALRGRAARTLGAGTRRALRPRSAAAGEDWAPKPLIAFAEAMRDADGEALAALTADRFEFTLRSPSGDLNVRSEEARTALGALAREVFGSTFTQMEWATSAQADLHALWFSGIRSDASRVDLAFALEVENERLRLVHLVSGGDPGGRRPAEWKSR